MTADRDARFLWVEGSPSAAENSPHDRRWRAAVAEVAQGQPAAVEVELDFLLEKRRLRIDPDNLVRLALDGCVTPASCRGGWPRSTRSLPRSARRHHWVSA